MRSPRQVWRDYRARRKSLRTAFRLLAASGVVRPANQGIRYALTEGRVDQIFPVQPGEWYRLIRWK